MSEADYIVVLDTGSTDGSYEMLKEDSRITCVEQKIINPWRFDVARNESMKLVPEDTDILFVLTLMKCLNRDGRKYYVIIGNLKIQDAIIHMHGHIMLQVSLKMYLNMIKFMQKLSLGISSA